MPRVAVLVPAYNEEMVIVRTVRSVLNSDYPNLHVIVIDDGSKDKTVELAREAYAAETADGRVQVLTKPNGGKAAALNFALANLTEEFYVGIASDEILGPMYPDYPDFSHGRRRLTLFLAQYWGGPTTYSEERGHPRLRMRHFPFTIGVRERDRWLTHRGLPSRVVVDRAHAPPHGSGKGPATATP